MRISADILSVIAARRHFLDGATKSEIATELGVSRFKVARMLERALATRLVEIVFHYPAGNIDYELSARLQSELRLKRAVVVADEPSQDALMTSLGSAAASMLSEICDDDDVIGFAWTRAFEAMSTYLGEVKAASVVQLCGAFPGAGTGRTSLDLVRDMARTIGGNAAMYHAPLLASDKDAAAAIRRQPDVLAAKAMHARVTKAVIGVGAWMSGQTSVWTAVPRSMRDRVAAAGAVAEICGGICLARDGRSLHTDVTDLAIGISASELRQVPEAIGVVFGPSKRDAVLAAVSGGYVTSLVTHAGLATALTAKAATRRATRPGSPPRGG